MQIKRESPERAAAATMPASSGTPGKSGRPPNTAYLALMKPDEDWREIEDSTERRKIQNRLAQRAYRRSLRNRNKELESLKKQLGTFQESSAAAAAATLSPSPHHARAASRSRSRSNSGASFRSLCPSPDALASSPSPPPALSGFAAAAAASGALPPCAGVPSSRAAPEWPRDGGSSAAALHAVGPYGVPDFMYFDAYPPPPTHDAAAAWISPPASSSEEGPDMQPPPQQQQQPPPPAFLPAFGGGGHAPTTPPEAADYLTTTAFSPFTAPDSLGLVYSQPQQHPHPPPHHHHHSGVLDPALFDDDAAATVDLLPPPPPQLLPPTPPPPPASSSTSTRLDPQHASLLHMAVASGNIEVLRLILDRVPPALARRPDMLAVLDHNNTPAHHAATTETSHGGPPPGPGYEPLC